MTDLTPIEQKEIQFQGEALTAVLVQDADGRENVYVPLRPLVEGMGLTWSSQYRRVKRNPVLNDVCISVAVTATEIDKSKRPNTINYLAIPISHLNGFLFGIDANRVREEIRPLIIQYQEKCYEVLYHAFNSVDSMRRFYKSIGHEDKWVETRITQHQIATTLNDVWLKNGVPIEQHEQLQDLLNKGAFDLTIDEHRQLKQLPDHAQLPDNMSLIELAIATLADATAVGISDNEETEGLEDSKKVAERAGSVAGKARRNYEQETGQKVVSSKNNLDRGKRPFLKDK